MRGRMETAGGGPHDGRRRVARAAAQLALDVGIVCAALAAHAGGVVGELLPAAKRLRGRGVDHRLEGRAEVDAVVELPRTRGRDEHGAAHAVEHMGRQRVRRRVQTRSLRSHRPVLRAPASRNLATGLLAAAVPLQL